MDVHKNARTTPHSRALIAQRVAAGERPAAVARAVGVRDRTVRKWVARAAEGPLALDDRSCRPHRSPRAISAGLMVEIQRLRKRRWTEAVIAEAVGLSRLTVARTLGLDPSVGDDARGSPGSAWTSSRTRRRLAHDGVVSTTNQADMRGRRIASARTLQSCVERVHFFASRLKRSRVVHVVLVSDEREEAPAPC